MGSVGSSLGCLKCMPCNSPGRSSNIHLLVGQDLMESLAYTNFKQPGEAFPLCRIAVWCTMLTTWKHQDGIQKLVTRSDVEKLKSKTYIPKLQVLEGQLQGAYQVVNQAQDFHFAAKCFGKLMTRSVLHLLQKEKWSREPTRSWQDQAKILEAFTEDMANPKLQAGKNDEPALVPRDLTQASAKEMALFQNPHIAQGKLHLAWVIVLFWLAQPFNGSAVGSTPACVGIYTLCIEVQPAEGPPWLGF